jgi:hypothetical protein
VSEKDKQIIEKELVMKYDYKELVEDDPIIQELFAERDLKSRAEGEALGEARGEITATRDAISAVLAIRFSPALAAQAQPIVISIQGVEGLKRLQRALLLVSDEQAVRMLLELPAQEDLL